jgi:large subunit ribosomal protein L29
MKAADLRSKSNEELNKELLALLREKVNLSIQKGTGQTVNSHRFKQIKRDIARINTVANESERA